MRARHLARPRLADQNPIALATPKYRIEARAWPGRFRLELHGRGRVRGRGESTEGKPGVLRMEERLVILVGFYPTRSARFLIARGVGWGAACVRRGAVDGVGGVDVQVRRIGECVT
jgi:hypothetical protein